MDQTTIDQITKIAQGVYRHSHETVRRVLSADDFASIGIIAVLESNNSERKPGNIAYTAMLSAIRRERGRGAQRRIALSYDETREGRGKACRNHRIVECDLALDAMPGSIADALRSHYLDGEPWQSPAQRMTVSRYLAKR